ncbi:MAG: putative manganese-dependent inorganic diphosphatase [Christensenellales bacterium]|jgi:manganese-dependent inorganic pyrophosphatase
MDRPVVITGHRHPDTDSIASSLAYAELKNRLGGGLFMPARLDEPNKETRYLLGRFGLDQPPLVRTLKTQVRDLDMDHPQPVEAWTTVKNAWRTMEENDLNTLPVVGEGGRLVGLVTAGDLAQRDMLGAMGTLRLDTTLENLLEALGGQLHAGDPAMSLQGSVQVAIQSRELLSRQVAPGDVVLCGDLPELQLAAVESGAAALVFQEGAQPADAVCRLAQQRGCALVLTRQSMYALCRQISQSQPISAFLITQGIVHFHLDDYLDEVRETMLSSRYRSYPVLDKNDCLVGSISRFHLIKPRRKRVILVDHNESGQSISGLEQAEILEIIDHHRLADIQTGSPIYFRNEPVGATATIISGMFLEAGMTPTPPIAGMLCGAILSDTVMFKSPTCTPRDQAMARRMAKIAGVDMQELGRSLFGAAVNIQEASCKELLLADFKEFTINGVKVGLGQLSLMDAAQFAPRREEMVALLASMRADRNLDMIGLMITDILKEGTLLLFDGLEDVVGRAFPGDVANHAIYLPGVLSRKKQVIPPITEIIG